MHVRARRRAIHFDGRIVTISIATKDKLLLPGDLKNKFPVNKITRIDHSPPTAWKPGRIVFVVTGISPEIVANVPMFADKLDENTFQYPAGMRRRVTELLEAIEQARGKK